MTAGVPILWVIIGAAAVASINPTSVGIMTQIAASALGRGHKTAKYTRTTLLFLLTIFTITSLFALGFLIIINQLNRNDFHYFAIVAALTFNLFALLDIKDFFWYGRGLSLSPPSYLAVKIHKHSKKLDSPTAVVALGILSTAAIAPAAICTLLGSMIIVRAAGASSNYAPIFSFVFILPMIAVSFAARGGTKISVITKWKEESKGTMRLYTGLLIAILSWVILLIESGAVKFR